MSCFCFVSLSLFSLISSFSPYSTSLCVFNHYHSHLIDLPLFDMYLELSDVYNNTMWGLTCITGMYFTFPSFIELNNIQPKIDEIFVSRSEGLSHLSICICIFRLKLLILSLQMELLFLAQVESYAAQVKEDTHILHAMQWLFFYTNNIV